jgi:plastocyanin
VDTSHLRRAVVGSAVVVAATIAFACSNDDDGGSTTATTEAAEQVVQVKLFQFQPQRVQVDVGTTVVWANGDDTVHQPTSGKPDAIDPLFDVTIDGVDATGSFSFDEPGTYPYFCQLHTSMTGEVVVD